MRERGRYQLQLMKTRNSSGVGQKIDLGFNLDTLRIEDIGDDDDDSGYGSAPTGSSVLDKIKRGNGVPDNSDAVNNDPSDGSSIGKVRAETDGAKLRSFLNNLGDD
jgi:hypothetical protein